jgi:hypothetical protein
MTHLVHKLRPYLNLGEVESEKEGIWDGGEFCHSMSIPGCRVDGGHVQIGGVAIRCHDTVVIE